MTGEPFLHACNEKAAISTKYQQHFTMMATQVPNKIIGEMLKLNHETRQKVDTVDPAYKVEDFVP